MSIDLDEFDPPDRPDFRRVGKGVPFVLNPEGKRVRYSRSSNSGKVLDDESNLTDWKLRTVVAGAAQRPELMAMASTLDVDVDKKKLRDIAEECLVAGKGQRRSIIGTAVHSMFDHIDREDGWIPPPQFAELCDAYSTMKVDWGFEVVDIEVHCINDEFRLAGTLDRRYRTSRTLVAPDGRIIPIGTVVVADHKTGRELEYAAGSYATQLAAYVDSLRYNVETDERSEFEPPSFPDWAFIIHADSAGTLVDVYWIDVEAGRKGLYLAQQVKEWRRRDDLLTLGRRIKLGHSVDPEMGIELEPPSSFGPNLPPVAPGSPVAASSEQVAPVAAFEQQEATGGSREASRADHLRGRVQAVINRSDVAAKALQLRWPKGVPGLKNPGHSMEQLDQVEAALEWVEKEHSMPFFDPWVDPAVEQSRQHHPSWSDRWANPSKVNDSPSSKEAVEARLAIQEGILNHPRSALLSRWVSEAIKGGLDTSIDTTAVAHALYEFASFDQVEWPDDDLTLMLDGSLRALGYQRGIQDLGRFSPDQAPVLMSAAFAIAAGNAMLLFDDDENPVVRTNVRKA